MPPSLDTPDWTKQVERWFEEVMKFGFSSNKIDPFSFKHSTGHYTQVKTRGEVFVDTPNNF